MSLVSLQGFDMASTTICKVLMGGGDTRGRRNARQILMMLRGLRIVRVVRVMRILHLVPALRMLLVSLMFSVKSLIWIIILVAMSILVFSIVITQIVTDHKISEGRENMVGHECELLDEYFGTLAATFLVLYQVITEGIHWGELAHVLMHEVHPALVSVMVLYTMFSVFAMMNVLTAFFCDNISRADEEDKKVLVCQDLWKAFCEETGDITEKLFLQRMHEPRMERFLAALELTPETLETDHFFQLIDKDNSGCLDVEELCTGCLRLTGPAKAMEVAGLMYILKQEVEAARLHRDMVERALKHTSTHERERGQRH